MTTTPPLSQRASQNNLPYIPPEILSKIFSLLTSYQVRRWALPVCKQWNALGHASIAEVVVNEWDRGLSLIKSSQTETKELLHSGTDILYCHNNSGSQDNGLASFLESILELPRDKKMRIKTIVMSTNWTFEEHWNKFLSIFSHVQVLHLTQFQVIETIEIDKILLQIPLLIELQIIPAENHFENPNTTLTHLVRFKNQVALPRLSLRKFSLWRVKIDFDDLFKILCQCPFLKYLRLAGISKSSTLSPTIGTRTDSKEIDNVSSKFFKEISECCPRLQDFHFSSPEMPWNRERIDGYRSAFPNLSLWSFISYNAEQLAFSHLQDWASQTLTKLEILISGSSNKAIGLQEFLCTATNLIHLDVLGVEILEKDLIVLEDDLPTLSVTALTPRSFSSLNNRIWACRQLQTLKIKYRQDVNCTRPKYHNRGFFAYIVHVLPELKDLTMYLDGFDYSVDSGFCLLSKLNKLSKLEVYNFYRYRRDPLSTYNEVGHLEWFSTSKDIIPWVEMSLLRKLEWEMSMMSKRYSSESNLDRNNFLSTFGNVREEWLDPSDLVIYKIQKSSCLENIVDVLDSLRKAQKRCWPELESMRFLHWHKQTIRRLRPELDHSNFGGYYYHRDYCNDSAYNGNNYFDIK